MAKLMKVLESMIVPRPAKALIDAVKAFTGGYSNIYKDSNLKTLRDKMVLLQFRRSRRHGVSQNTC